MVEDEPAIADVISMYLERSGYRVAVATDGAMALDTIRTRQPSAIILDVGLPGLDGIEVCRRLRSAGNWTPVLFVTARDDEIDRVVGLELGADDYITKPFSAGACCPVTSVLRRSEVRPDEKSILEVGAVRLDTGSRRAHAGGREVELTATEFDLIAYLMRRPGWVFSPSRSLWTSGATARWPAPGL